MIYVVIGLVVVLIAIAAFLALIYNSLVRLRNQYENAFAQIDVQLKRRYDLIPNLVETAKGYMKHEQETLTKVIEARNQAISAQKQASANPGDPSSMKELAKAESGLDGAIGRLLMIAESYPDLKANQNMLSIQEELTSTENKVSFARQGFNDSVTNYNNSREVFPAVMVAGMFGFSEAQLLEIEDPKEREAPKVSF